jgi:hypothetical protein
LIEESQSLFRTSELNQAIPQNAQKTDHGRQVVCRLRVLDRSADHEHRFAGLPLQPRNYSKFAVRPIDPLGVIQFLSDCKRFAPIRLGEQRVVVLIGLALDDQAAQTDLIVGRRER